MPPVPFQAMVGPSYTMFSPKAEIQKSMNLYRQRVESDQGINPFVLVKSPGILPYITAFTAGAVRGCLSRDTSTKFHAFVAVGGTIYDILETAITTSYSGVDNSTDDPVYMAASPTTLMVVSNGHLYRINSGALTEIIPGTALGVLSVVFLKNYFVVLYDDLQQFGWSEDDGATFPGGNVQTFEADSNAVFAMAVIHQQLCLVGTRISQWYYVGQNPDAPFVPNDSGVIRSGTRAPATLKALGESLYWLESHEDGDYAIVRCEGYNAVPISTLAVENAIRTYAKSGTVDDCIFLPYQFGKQEFMIVTFPYADKTWVYDATLNEWHERCWTEYATGEEHRHRANAIMSAFGKILIGDHTNGILYEMSPDIYHDAGFPIYFDRRAPHILGNNKFVEYGALDLGIETGVGLVTPLWLHSYDRDGATFATDLAAAVSALTVTAAQELVLTQIYNGEPYTPLDPYPAQSVMVNLGFDPWGATATIDGTVYGTEPMIEMYISNDGGKNFGAGLQRSLGASGTDKRVKWERGGVARDRVYKLTGNAPVKIAITNAWFESLEELSA